MIIRTYGCDACGHVMDVELRAEQWDQEAPECPRCAQFTHQEFVPPKIGGSNLAKAHRMAEDILEHDHGVADYCHPKGDYKPTVRYNDSAPQAPSSWGSAGGAISEAISLGRDVRLRHGTGLEILQTGLKNGTIPDMIGNAKKNSMRIW